MRYQFTAIGAFIAIIVLLIVFMKLFPAWETGRRGMAIALPTIALASWLSIWLGRKLSFGYMKAVRGKDEAALGDPPPDNRYVGVSYTNGDWAFRGDTSWDRGFLWVEGGDLNFRGFGPAFSLPAGCIENMRVRRTVSFATNSLPRVYIDWSDSGSPVNTVSLEVRDAGSRDATIRATDELLEWLRELLHPVPDDALREHLPFESSQLDFNRTSSHGAVLPSDRVVGVLCLVGALAIVMIIGLAVEKSLRVRTSPFVGGFGAMCLPVYSAVVFKRVEKRARAQRQS